MNDAQIATHQAEASTIAGSILSAGQRLGDGQASTMVLLESVCVVVLLTVAPAAAQIALSELARGIRLRIAEQPQGPPLECA